MPISAVHTCRCEITLTAGLGNVAVSSRGHCSICSGLLVLLCSRHRICITIVDNTICGDLLLLRLFDLLKTIERKHARERTQHVGAALWIGAQRGDFGRINHGRVIVKYTVPHKSSNVQAEKNNPSQYSRAAKTHDTANNGINKRKNYCGDTYLDSRSGKMN